MQWSDGNNKKNSFQCLWRSGRPGFPVFLLKFMTELKTEVLLVSPGETLLGNRGKSIDDDENRRGKKYSKFSVI